MTRSRDGFARRLFAGYRALFRGAVQLLGAAIVLLVVSAAISLPVWYFAHNTPVAFDIGVLTAIAAAFVWFVVRRLRSGPKRWTFRGVTVSIAIVAVPVFVLVLALAAHSVALALAGALLLSGVIAWRVVPS
jgi:hypothetical protein